MAKIRKHQDLKVFQMTFDGASDAETEAAETHVWLDFALKCEYIEEQTHADLYQRYDYILGKLVNMSRAPEQWKL